MRYKAFLCSIAVVGLILPLMAGAQVPAHPGQINLNQQGIETLIDNILNTIWILAVAAVIVLFIFIAFRFITAQGNMDKIKEARNAFVFGIVGVVVLVLAWSIVTILRMNLGV